MRSAMRRVLQTEGFVTEVFSTAEAFLASGAASRAQCLVLDIQLPGMSGIELHRHLLTLGSSIQTVFVTAHEDLCSSGLTMKGTTHCLVKPFPAETLIKAVNGSLVQ